MAVFPLFYFYYAAGEIVCVALVLMYLFWCIKKIIKSIVVMF